MGISKVISFLYYSVATWVGVEYRRYCRDERGAVAIIFALAFVPMLIATGLAVDLSVAYTTRVRLQKAVDVAGLAVGNKANDSSADHNAIFNAYFNANFQDSAFGTAKNVTVSVQDGVVTVSAQADVPMNFLQIIGHEILTVSASAQMVATTTGLELVLALDNTGSMDGSRLTSLKSASTELIEILFGDEAEPDNLKIGLVPFAGAVNIGPSSTAFTTDPSLLDFGSTTWQGCVEARTYPADVNDTTTGVDGLWTPFNWADTSFFGSNNWSGFGGFIDTSLPSDRGPNKFCPLEVTPLTNAKQTLLDEIDAMWAAGFTHINQGAIWAHRLISPDEPFTEGAAYGDEETNKAVIILTDGANTTSDSVYTAYGYRFEGRLDGQTSSSGTSAELDSRLLEVCTNMKGDGITVYTITFEVSDSDIQDLMENCATDAAKYFNSPGTDDLQEIFEAIAKELKALHISQ